MAVIIIQPGLRGSWILMTLLVRGILEINYPSQSQPLSSHSLTSTNTKLIDKDRLTRLRAADEKICLCFPGPAGSWWGTVEMMPLQ